MKLRFAPSALVLLVAMTMATGAFAQGIFTVSAGSEARGRSNGYAERAGGITLFLENGSVVAGDEGTVVISYGVPIENDVGALATPDEAIDISICAGGRLAADANEVAVNKARGTITITMGGADGGTCSPNGGAINVDNVLLNLVGSGLSSIDATIRGTGDVRTGNTTQAVISSIVDPLTDDDVDVGQQVTLIRHTGERASGDKKSQFHLVITEPHVDSFAGGQLELEFSGIPEDVSLTGLDAWLMTAKEFDTETFARTALANQIPVGELDERTASAEDDDTVIVYLTPDMLPAVVAPEDDDDTNPAPTIAEGMGGSLSTTVSDVVIVRGMIEGTDDEDLLPIDLTVNVTVDLGPTGDEDDDDIPRFDSDATTAVTVIKSTPSRTTLKAPFVTNDGSFETGVAVANMGTGGSAQPGAVTLDFYVNNGMKLSHTTSASSPGAGLNANGMLDPGGSWSVLLSQVFPGSPGNGYLIITTDFTDAGANVFISDFAGFSVTGSVGP